MTRGWRVGAGPAVTAIGPDEVPDPLENGCRPALRPAAGGLRRERDATARELRKAKDRDAADAVAKLPKPSQSAWAANTLAREQRKLVKALLKAGDKLRAAQEGAVAGKGAGTLREAAAVEREAVDALVEAAKELKPAGRKPTARRSTACARRCTPPPPTTTSATRSTTAGSSRTSPAAVPGA